MSADAKTKNAKELETAFNFDDDDDSGGGTLKATVAPPYDVAAHAKAGTQAEQEGDAPVSERPTVAPPFDVAAFAKESHAASAALSDDGRHARSGKPATIQVTPALDLRQRLAAGDYAGALSLAESILRDASSPDAQAARAAVEECRGKLLDKYLGQLGRLDRVPEVVVGHDQLRALHIDHRAGFLLSLVDGVSSFDLILDICGMARFDAVRILAGLLQEQIVQIQRLPR